jgi:hypothetical protein
VRSTSNLRNPSATATLAVALGIMLASSGFVGILELSLFDRPLVSRTATESRPVPAAAAPSLEPAPEPEPEPRVEPPAPSRPSSVVLAAAAPQFVRIGVLDVVAPLVQVGLLPDGGMEIPDDVDLVGWFAVEGRVISPGDPGTAVLAGHRDSRRSGPGALHALSKVAEGDVIGVFHADGTVSDWRITEILTTPRDELPVAELFTGSGTPRLAVVTCGGWFNLLTRSYSHNTIVIAHRIA